MAKVRRVPVYVRMPADLRAQLVALAESDHRSANTFTVLRLEEGLDQWLEERKRRRAADPVRARTVSPPAIDKQLATIKRELRTAGQLPPLPADLSPEERRMVGLPAEQLSVPPVPPGAEELSPEMADLVAEVLKLGLVQGQRANE